jgi:hypothetical protein
MIGFGGVPSVARIPSNHGANSICDVETFRDTAKPPTCGGGLPTTTVHPIQQVWAARAFEL